MYTTASEIPSNDGVRHYFDTKCSNRIIQLKIFMNFMRKNGSKFTMSNPIRRFVGCLRNDTSFEVWCSVFI